MKKDISNIVINNTPPINSSNLWLDSNSGTLKYYKGTKWVDTKLDVNVPVENSYIADDNDTVKLSSSIGQRIDIDNVYKFKDVYISTNGNAYLTQMIDPVSIPAYSTDLINFTPIQLSNFIEYNRNYTWYTFVDNDIFCCLRTDGFLIFTLDGRNYDSVLLTIGEDLIAEDDVNLQFTSIYIDSTYSSKITAFSKKRDSSIYNLYTLYFDKEDINIEYLSNAEFSKEEYPVNEVPGIDKNAEELLWYAYCDNYKSFLYKKEDNIYFCNYDITISLPFEPTYCNIQYYPCGIFRIGKEFLLDIYTYNIVMGLIMNIIADSKSLLYKSIAFDEEYIKDSLYLVYYENFKETKYYFGNKINIQDPYQLLDVVLSLHFIKDGSLYKRGFDFNGIKIDNTVTKLKSLIKPVTTVINDMIKEFKKIKQEIYMLLWR